MSAALRAKRRTTMFRTIGRFVVLGLMIAGLLGIAGGGQAGATVHPLSCAEHSAGAAVDTPADEQDPPGITPGGPDSGQAAVAQPIEAVLSNTTTNDSAHAFKADGC